jgi:hypothetical protein
MFGGLIEATALCDILYLMEKFSNDQARVRAEDFESNDSLILFERLENPDIFEQMVRTTMAGYEARVASGEPITLIEYDENGKMQFHEEPYPQPSEEEVRQQILDDIQRVKSYTPISFNDNPPSAAGIGVFWKNPDGSEPTSEQKSSMVAHEKGHVVRQFPGGEAGDRYYAKLFGNAFDVGQIIYTEEEYERDVAFKRKEAQKNHDKFIEEGINVLGLDESDMTYDKMKEGITEYLSRPAELTERMSQIKNYLGFRGDEEFTQENLDYARQYYIEETGIDNNMRQFFEAIKDDKEFIVLMNSVGI